MKRLVGIVLALAACEQADDRMFPVNPGGGGGGSSGQYMPDAPAAPDDGGTMITGRVCLLLTNPQSLATCAATGAGGFTVALGTVTTTTADDGAFTIARPATPPAAWRVTGIGLVASALKYGSGTTLPVFDEQIYQQMLAGTGAPNGAALMLRVQRGGFAVKDATVATQPSAQVYYDRQDFAVWQDGATGDFGAAWAPGLAAGSITPTVTSNATSTTLAAQPVYQDTITFAVAEIP